MAFHGFQMPRIDRLATVYACHPLAKLTGWSSRRCAPILAYHSISENLFGKLDPYHQINTSAAVFRKQMQWLCRESYCTIDMAQLIAALDNGQDLSKTVVLTFDGGYQDFYTDAFPILKQCGFTATVFLVSGRVRDKAVCIEGANYLTWREIRELHAHGVRFGSHSVTHADFRSLGPGEIEYELGFSKETIEQGIGAPVESFSYPFTLPEEDREFVRYLSDTLENLCYTNGVSSAAGRAKQTDARFFLPRLPINTWDDARLFKAKLEGGYDWLRWPQWLYRFAHHSVSLMAASTLGSTK
jgi:peptidoglycan/xylan/chitin deacetylase (PgdA/CDA1 family)